MTTDFRAARARSFDGAAAQYAANRPSYPPALFDALEDLAGRPLYGARVADVGAGTGIATALLHERGADVVAVEPGDGMAAEFRRRLATVPVLRGDGNALPLATSCVDLLTYAQSWHWTDPVRSVPEALRVLRPGGALAMWWNTDAPDVPWLAAQSDRISRRFATEEAARNSPAGARPLERAFAGVAQPPAFTHRVVRWSRRIPVDTRLANIGSHSIFLVLGEERAGAFLAEEREQLLTEFPDGFVEEVYDVHLLVAVAP
ncbi:class I SAM-dependent methyltransferase [Streptomyces sp. NPDC048664]|uniref:class I SAM-dependent methyltransferase n=1 Tax=Streptomyces sp. NPDC048664 TaxID=3154505 RepID=UPI00341D2AE4